MPASSNIGLNNMTKQKIIFIWFTLFTLNASAQMMKQTDSSIYNTARIIPVDKALLLKNMAVIFNMQYANNNNFRDGKYAGSNYAMNQFRLEIRGDVSDKVSFRFRDRYTRDPLPQSVDNIDHSIDMAFVQVRLSSRFSLAFGKMSADYGGYEFEANPINVFEYNDIIGHSESSLAGIQSTWKIAKNHELTFQVLNSRTQTFAEAYNSIPGISAAKFPFALVGNWRGDFAKGKFATFWSYGLFKEAKSTDVYYTALGNQLKLKKWLIQYDFKYSPEDIDRTTVITGIIPKAYSPFPASNTRYIEHWLHAEYALVSRWKITLTGMISDVYWYGNPDPEKNNQLRTSYGFATSLEFSPFKDLNLRFFVAGVSRYYRYTNYAKSKFGLTNSTNGSIMIGFISPLLVL
jgi:hypothetical protein